MQVAFPMVDKIRLMPIKTAIKALTEITTLTNPQRSKITKQKHYSS